MDDNVKNILRETNIIADITKRLDSLLHITESDDENNNNNDSNVTSITSQLVPPLRILNHLSHYRIFAHQMGSSK